MSIGLKTTRNSPQRTAQFVTRNSSNFQPQKRVRGARVTGGDVASDWGVALLHHTDRRLSLIKVLADVWSPDELVSKDATAKWPGHFHMDVAV